VDDILCSKLTKVSTSSVLSIRIILDVKTWRLFETSNFAMNKFKGPCICTSENIQ
jgi:hypothetical protein